MGDARSSQSAELAAVSGDQEALAPRSRVQAPAAPGLAPPERVAAASGGAPVEARVVEAWCTWLDALATDAEAAMAAAIAYQGLEDHGRDQWLSALEQDSDRVTVPRIAVYAPLLAVEFDPERRERIEKSIGTMDAGMAPLASPRALCGMAPNGERIATVVSPLYLDFVQVLACGYDSRRGFSWVKHDPIVNKSGAPQAGLELSGAILEKAPLDSVVDDLAITVLAHEKSGREVPAALRSFADLFGPRIDGGASQPL